MSTRGAVAWINAKGEWEGVYNHFDSYPTGLGEDVFKKCRTLGIGNVIKALERVGDWREFESGGVCEYCGKVAVEQPHSISGKALFPEKGHKGFPDPEAKFHKHGNSKADHFDPRKDPLFMEWVYLLRPDRHAIEVYMFSEVAKDYPGAVNIHEKYEQDKPCYYGHLFVGTLDVSNPSFDAAWFEKHADDVRDKEEKKLKRKAAK